MKFAEATGRLAPWGQPERYERWRVAAVASYRKGKAAGGCNCMLCKGHKLKGFAKWHRRKSDLVEKARLRTE